MKTIGTLAAAIAAAAAWGETVIELGPDGALASPAAAIEKVRADRAADRIGKDEPVTVRFAPGRYEVGAGLEVTGDVAPIAFVGPEKGEAVISGGRKLGPFVAGADGVWHRAKVVNLIPGDRYRCGQVKDRFLIVKSDEVAEPKALRYLFSKPWYGSLQNESNLPLGPFKIGD